MTLRIGTGAGYAADRIEPAQDLAERGRLDWLVFECLAERTLAHGHLARMRDPARGYNAMLERRLAAVLPACRAQGTAIVTNMGAANVPAAGRAALETARRCGLEGMLIATVEGDDVTHLMTPGTLLPELGQTIAESGLRVVGANAYLGTEVLLQALRHEPAVTIAGRVADPALFLAPLAQRFGWALDDWPRLGAGTVIGHLLECSTQVTGGNFADPGHKAVPNLADIGYPLAECAADGSAVVTKLPGSGGLVSVHGVKEQLLYEVHDPAAYLTPDVTADFTGVRLAQQGADRVAVSGASGRERPRQLKVTVGFDGGLLAEAEISYAGPGAVGRGELAGEILRERMTRVRGYHGPLRIDLIGVNAIHATALRRRSETQDVRLRAALRTADRDLAELLLAEVDNLYMAGPAGGGGVRGHITPSVTTQSLFLERDAIRPRIEVFRA
jgi:hypothetical protein